VIAFAKLLILFIENSIVHQKKSKPSNSAQSKQILIGHSDKLQKHIYFRNNTYIKTYNCLSVSYKNKTDYIFILPLLDNIAWLKKILSCNQN